MPSGALVALESALLELGDLEVSRKSAARRLRVRLKTDRAIGRAAIVLLCSHFERYIYAVNEELVELAVQRKISASLIPETIRLLHSKHAIDALAEMSWERRTAPLETLVREESWLWNGGSGGLMEPSRILAWMKSPKPDALIRYYRSWGIQDIFSAVTRTPRTRGEMFLSIRGLVDKRNNVAHGDLNESATRSDITRYKRAVQIFCQRSDRELAKHARVLFGVAVW